MSRRTLATVVALTVAAPSSSSTAAPATGERRLTLERADDIARHTADEHGAVDHALSARLDVTLRADGRVFARERGHSTDLISDERGTLEERARWDYHWRGTWSERSELSIELEVTSTSCTQTKQVDHEPTEDHACDAERTPATKHVTLTCVRSLVPATQHSVPVWSCTPPDDEGLRWTLPQAGCLRELGGRAGRQTYARCSK